jgi:hypothetical protein
LKNKKIEPKLKEIRSLIESTVFSSQKGMELTTLEILRRLCLASDVSSVSYITTDPRIEEICKTQWYIKNVERVNSDSEYPEEVIFLTAEPPEAVEEMPNYEGSMVKDSEAPKVNPEEIDKLNRSLVHQGQVLLEDLESKLNKKLESIGARIGVPKDDVVFQGTLSKKEVEKTKNKLKEAGVTKYPFVLLSVESSPPNLGELVNKVEDNISVIEIGKDNNISRSSGPLLRYSPESIIEEMAILLTPSLVKSQKVPSVITDDLILAEFSAAHKIKTLYIYRGNRYSWDGPRSPYIIPISFSQ